MYLPSYHRFEDRTAQFDLIERHPLGTWVCQGGGGLIANHRPFVLHRAQGDPGTLSAWIDPHDAEARAVPTWNYVVVHAHGVVRWTADREGTVLGLNASGSEAARTMAALVRHALDHSPL